MISTIYLEHDAVGHPVAERITQRFPGATLIPIARYGEVFNRKAQNFRLQKKNPSLILARKFANFVLETPPGYGIGDARNFYVSHMLNCIYDCRYCFLQGMYRSAHYVLFVNYEDFERDMLRRLAQTPSLSTCFFSGYDCDSLAFEPVTGYVSQLLPFFEQHPQARLELRTKSTQIRTLLKRTPLANVVVAFSFTPEQLSRALEHKVPALQRRIEAMATLAENGWPIGLRFDPLIYQRDYQDQYRQLLSAIFEKLQARCIHSVSLGPFRLPKAFFRTLQRLYPDEALFAGGFDERNGLVSYTRSIEEEMRQFCNTELMRYVSSEQLYPCAF